MSSRAHREKTPTKTIPSVATVDSNYRRLAQHYNFHSMMNKTFLNEIIANI